MPVEGCPETRFVGFANYCGDGCQIVVGSLKLVTHDYSVGRIVNVVVHHNCRDRNPCNNGGGPDDNANDGSCVMWCDLLG